MPKHLSLIFIFLFYFLFFYFSWLVCENFGLVVFVEFKIAYFGAI